MDLGAVYRKTQKGLEELARRTVLGMRERTLLVMVDGKTPAAELLARAKQMPDPQGLLAKLVEGGFIVAAAPPASAEPNAASAPPAASVQPEVSLQETVRFARRYILDTLGPDGDILVEAIEKAKTLPQLRLALEKSRDALQLGAGKRKAEEFWGGVTLRLPAA
jgi:hypothetical protein